MNMHTLRLRKPWIVAALLAALWGAAPQALHAAAATDDSPADARQLPEYFDQLRHRLGPPASEGIARWVALDRGHGSHPPLTGKVRIRYPATSM